MAGIADRQGRKPSARKAQLLEIAAKVFAEEGYRETGIEQILRLAGLTGPALYRHFTSKQEILDTICLHELQNSLELARKIQAEDSPSAEEALRKVISTRLDYLFSARGYGLFLVSSQKAHTSAEVQDKLSQMQREFRTIFADLLAKVRLDATSNEIKIAYFMTQKMSLHTIWRANRRAMLPQADLKQLLEKMIWNMLMC